MHHQLISTAILSTMLVLAPHTHADDANAMRDLTAKAETGDAAAQLALAVRYRDGKGVAKDNAEAMRWAHLAAENLFILCNPAIATPGLQLITAADLKHYWRSDHYGELSKNVLSRPAIVIEKP